jgi:DNA polymerase-3 subunit delta
MLKGSPSGGYLFFGEEDYMKATVLRMARAAICPAEDALSSLNDLRMEGLDFTTEALLDAMAAPPVGAERKIITVTGLNFQTMRSAELDSLCNALAVLPDYPYLLFILSVTEGALDAGNLPKRPSALLCTLGEYLTPVYFERNTPAKLYGWVQKHYLHNGVQAAQAVCQFTVAYCGRNMYTLASEIDKVSFFCLAHGRSQAVEEDVRLCATPAMEYDAFAFTNAVMEQRRSDALAILRDLKLRRVEPLYILSEVSRVVVGLASVQALANSGKTAGEISATLKMHEYQVGLYLRQVRKIQPDTLRATVRACQAADLSLKRSVTDGYAVMERLICAL